MELLFCCVAACQLLSWPLRLYTRSVTNQKERNIAVIFCVLRARYGSGSKYTRVPKLSIRCGTVADGRARAGSSTQMEVI